MTRSPSLWRRFTRSLTTRPPVGVTDGSAPDTDAALAEARRYAETGLWADAARQLAALVDAEPDLAEGHRELARVADELATWHGSFVAADPVAGTDLRRFVSLAELRRGRTAHDVLDDPIGAGRRAMERAIELRPRSVAWLAPLAEFREAEGDLDGAIEAYERLIAASETSHSAWVVRSRHLWQFQLERGHHRRGTPRVDDPLFAATLEPGDQVDPSAEPVGVYRARFTHQGLNVGGFLVDPAVDHVEVALDGTVLRRINVGVSQPLRRFDMVLRRPVLDVAPPDARLTVATPAGAILWASGWGRHVQVRLPRATGRLPALLALDVKVDKKGGLTPTADEAAARQRDLLRLYREVRTFFTTQLGRDLFVLYGTLLGVHRQGVLIPGDDDLDCGYVATGHDPAAVKAEAVQFIESLVRAGFSVSVNRRGRLFRVHHESFGDPTLHLDVHPVWFEGPELYVHNHHRFPATVDDLLPPDDRAVDGVQVLVPRRAEVLLERFYGTGWRTPDPGYVDDASGADPAVMARLSEALLTPDEHRELAARIDDPSLRRAGQGRLVAIARQSLYPLDAFIE